VRLWSLIGGVWQHIDYTYTEANFVARMISPAPGSALAGSSTTFTWTAGTGATQYAVYLGSTPGANDLGYTFLAGTSYTANILAVRGATLYVRLWSMIGGVWQNQYVDYTYSEANFHMITPAQGSALAGGSVTFTWTAINGASLYSIWFGTTPGGYNLGSFDLAGTSYTANLPVLGAPLYVRLWYVIGGVWQYIDYTYTEANLVARIITPVPGGTLLGTSIAFTWTAGTGVTQYALYFGSTPGANDLGYTFLAGTAYTASLPVRSATLYVRLWSLIGGVWQNVDYTYTH
jgi:hypothetical protein